MEMDKNLSIHICDRSHVNITLNVYNCGNRNLGMDGNEETFHPDHYIFMYVKEGSGMAIQAKVPHKLEAGQCFTIFPGIGATIQPDVKHGMNVSWVAFSGYMVDRYLMRAKISAYEPVFLDNAEREIEAMMDTLLRFATRQTNRYCPIMSQMYRIFTFLLDHAPRDIKTHDATPEMYLVKALDFIDIYYQDEISVEDIAEGVGINRKALYSVFKQLTGFSTRDYLIFYRMSKATELLKMTSLPVENVAVSVGYRDQFHFSKEFKKNVGYSPSEYRKIVVQDPSKEYRAPIDTVRQQYPVVGNTF